MGVRRIIMIKKIFGKRNNNVNKDMVKVRYSNWLLKDEINKWLKYMNIESFNDVLINIGFKKGDCVYLDGIDVNKIWLVSGFTVATILTSLLETLDISPYVSIPLI